VPTRALDPAHPSARDEPVRIGGIAHVMLDEGLIDEEFLRERADGLPGLAALLTEYPPAVAAAISGVAAADIVTAARLYGRSRCPAIVTRRHNTLHEINRGGLPVGRDDHDQNAGEDQRDRIGEPLHHQDPPVVAVGQSETGQGR
jgi:hypothetical protein